MAGTISIQAVDQGGSVPPRWRELHTEAIRPQIFLTDQGGYTVPLWRELHTEAVRPVVVSVDQGGYTAPRWRELGPSVRPIVVSEPYPSQPFIDGLTPVLVGSDWRLAVLRAAKLDDNVVLPALDPLPGDQVEYGGSLLVPCGARIPEFGDVELLGDGASGYSLSSGPGLKNSRTIIVIEDTLVYMDGAAQNDWTVVSTANLINGFNYALTPPAAAGVSVGVDREIQVYLEGVEGFWASWEFDVPPDIKLVSHNEGDAVDKFGPIVIEIIGGAGIELTSIAIQIRIDDTLETLLDGAKQWFTIGWKASSVETLSDGLRISLVPDSQATWRNEEVLEVIASYDDGALSVSESFDLVGPVRPYVARIRQMVISSLIDRDEVN